MSRRDNLALLKEQLDMLNDSRKMLDYSYGICKRIGKKRAYTFEELDRFESLTGRFARTSDILVQKTFRFIDILELEPQDSVIDRINQAERRRIIPSAETLKRIRLIRNDIAHNYLPQAEEYIFDGVLELVPFLLKAVDKTILYCQKFFKDKG